MLAEPPEAARSIEVLQTTSLPPSSAPTATGWSDSCRAGFAPAREWRLSTAHSMDNVSIIGLDISKRSFQVHGATADGAPVLRRKLTRAKVLEFLASQARCLVVMETCGGAHHWGREIQQLGHEVRLIAPIYVKAFVKHQKSDARDAAAIVEAAQRPTMRFVAVKTAAGPGPLDGVP